MPGNFLALYFDDLNTSDMDMIYARGAAEIAIWPPIFDPRDRTAIFTSGQMLSDFTVDPQQIHTTLARLREQCALYHSGSQLPRFLRLSSHGDYATEP